MRSGLYRRVWKYLRPFVGVLGFAFLLSVVASVLDGISFALLIPLFQSLFETGAGAGPPSPAERGLELLFGSWLSGGGWNGVRVAALLILGAMAFKNLAGYLTAFLEVKVEESLSRDLRRALFDHLLNQDLTFYRQARSGDLVSRMLADADQVKLVVRAGMAALIRNAILISVYLAVLFAISWRVTLLALVLAPLLALTLAPLLRGIRARVSAALEQRGEMTVRMAETVAGMRLVKIHGAEDHERRRFGAALDRYFGSILGAEKLAIMASPLSETLAATVVVGVLLVLTGMVGFEPILEPALFITFVAVTVRLLPPVKSITQYPALLEPGLAAAERVFEVLNRSPRADYDQGTRDLPEDWNEIRFRDVWFGYEPGNWVLKGVNLTVGRGEVVALVGRSGVGKSTLVDLLPRFADPDRGEVLIDGVPLAEFRLRSLRLAFGYVSQESVIFNDSVKDNVAYGCSEVPMEGVERAVRRANAHDFVAALPKGYDTVLGERGVRLSGGERQRIALARALYGDPPILILDEATSALDLESERQIQEALDRSFAGRTAIIIAHRLATVRRADRIVVLSDGQIVDQGSHGELLRRSDEYQQLQELELAGLGSE